MRLPRRIFLNVVIFVSSFLVVSYHKTSQNTCRALQPKLFTLLLKHTPFKKKNKIFTSNCAVCSNTGGVFFGGGRGCYPAHISAGAGRRGLESAAQFSTGCIVIGGTVCRAASFIQVVILHTISGSRHWNPPHSLRRAGLLSAAQFRCGVHRSAKKIVVIGRTIWTFF